MSHIEAEKWLKHLMKAVKDGRITIDQAYDEVFYEIKSGEHSKETETMYYNFTRGNHV
ncbi:UNVERIFIED_CONTAM: fusion protein of two pks domain [Bacteriophage sp.]